jgi:aromatic ring-opening dioxygenase catalytic subunit (LigB family)
MSATANRMPTFYIPHGGGPCFFMEWTMGPRDAWAPLAAWLRAWPGTLPARPSALLVISGHWEARVTTVTTAEAPPLLFDYYGFPAHTYELTWPAPGAPKLAERVRGLLGAAGHESAGDARRGFDHGVFVPLKVAFPEAEVPTVALSLRAGLDPREHLAIGAALAPLRDEGVLIVGSGNSYHNMRGFMSGTGLADSERFDGWLGEVVGSPRERREEALIGWRRAPSGVAAHPREEHLLPLHVAAGAVLGDAGEIVFRDRAMRAVTSAVRFG